MAKVGYGVGEALGIWYEKCSKKDASVICIRSIKYLKARKRTMDILTPVGEDVGDREGKAVGA